MPAGSIISMYSSVACQHVHCESAEGFLSEYLG